MSPPPTTPFGKLVQWDRDVSFLLYRRYHAHLPRLPLLLLEVSGHGVPWLLIPIVILVLQPALSPTGAALLLNFVALTVLDLAVIGVLKPLFRRQRPAYNSGIGQVTIHIVDQFSFPSGHATRAGLVAAFLVLVQADHHAVGLADAFRSSWTLAATMVWAVAVCVSRVVLGRHHVLDVVFGAALGVAYVVWWQGVWLSDVFSSQLRDGLRHSLLGSARLVSAAAPIRSGL